jgi:AcrR family transcriptional regulator
MDAATATVGADGPAAVSLRSLAAQAGVSHAAPVHHFGDKAGLFSAIALEGFDLLADELGTVWAETGDFGEVGVRYVRFAVTHPGHFTVMFQPDLAGGASPELELAKERAFATLNDPIAASGWGVNAEGRQTVALASWSIVHGLATLILSGNLPDVLPADVDELARRVLRTPEPCETPESGQTTRSPSAARYGSP